MSIGDAACAIGKGLLAGFVGTAVMTLSSTLEMKLRDREPSDTPVRAAEKVLQFEPADESARRRISQLVHFGYGTAWGAVRGLIGHAGVRGWPAGLLHFLAVWISGQIMLPALDLAPPSTEWGAEELAIDGMHHIVYATATSAAYDYLSQ